MPDDPKRNAAKAVKAAQKQFERDSKAAREARRRAFAQAQEDGLSLRDIGELVRLDHTKGSCTTNRTCPQRTYWISGSRAILSTTATPNFHLSSTSGGVTKARHSGLNCLLSATQLQDLH